MRRTLLAALITLLALAGSALAQDSLGDIARKHRKQRSKSPGAMVFTNDNLPGKTPGSAVADSTTASAPASDAAPADSAAGASSAAPAADSAAPADGMAQTPEERAKQEAEWRGRFAEQTRVISQAERELDVLERENKLRVAVFYADAGARLRDDRKFADEQRKYEADIATKKQEVEAARARLEEMREELRRAGLPSSWGE
jgi:hypothetical protein